MHSIFYSPIYEALENELSNSESEPETTDIDPTADIPENQNTDQSVPDENMGAESNSQNPNANLQNDVQDPSQNPQVENPQDDLITKFQKYLLFLKLKDLQYKISLTEYKDHSEFKELTTLLNLILEFFSIFKYDQVFTLSTLLTEKFSKIKLEKIKK